MQQIPSVDLRDFLSVSYTHLDVYKRQPFEFGTLIKILSTLIATDWSNYQSENDIFVIK